MPKKVTNKNEEKLKSYLQSVKHDTKPSNSKNKKHRRKS
jgi:hypothetical protein